MLTASLITAALAVAGVSFGLKRADIREAQIEARNFPEGQFVNVAGRDVHVVVKGEGPDLVLIHGAGGSTRDFTMALADKLADQFRLIIFDRPGHGWTQQIDPEHDDAWTSQSDSPRAQARHLAEAARALGVKNPLVLGHSFGGAVAMGWALEAEAAGILILSGATMPWPGSIDWQYKVLGSPLGSALVPPLVPAVLSQDYVENTLQGVFKPDPVPDDYLSRAGVMMAIRAITLRANNRQVNALRPHVVEMSRDYPKLTMPFEILHGTADKTVYAEIHAEPLAALVADANVTLLDGVGHMPHHIVPDQVIDAIERLATRAGLR
ncbi:MAG: alpha/beta hydrolase [Silicimonas sp.]|nr:alpha/beta hydrolase [Silicimonas sp.]